MSDDQIDVKINADSAGVASGMKAAVDAVKGGTEGMKGAIEALGGAFEAVMAPLAAFMAVLKGGQFLKESVDETVNFYKESAKLGKQLGVSANEAAQLGMAIKGVNGTTEQFSGAAGMLTRQVRQNEEAVKKMGLQTRNTDGTYRNSKDLMMDSIKVLNGYKEGTDRNLAAQVLFGRGASNLGPILKLNNEALEEAKKRQEELGLVITQEGQKAVADYRKAMVDCKEVLEGVSVTVGNAVIPILTRLAEWFSSIGPTVVAVFKGAMEVLSAVLSTTVDIISFLWDTCVDVFNEIASLVSDMIGGEATTSMITWDNAIKVVKVTLLSIKAAIELVIDVIKGFVDVTIAYFTMWKNVVSAALRLDFGGIQAAWNNGMANIENRVHQAAVKISNDMSAIGQQYQAIMSGKPMSTAPVAGPSGLGGGFTNPKGGGGAGDHKGGKKGGGGEKTRTSKWSEELDEQKLAQEKMNQQNDTFFEFSKQQEAEYWQKILERHDLSAKERKEVEKKYLDAALAVRKEQFDAHMEGLKNELEAYKNNMDERLRIAEQIAEEMKARFGAESKEYKQAAGEVMQIEREKAAQIMAINEEIYNAKIDGMMAEVDARQQQAEAEANLGLITNEQLLAQQREFENERYKIQHEALERKLQMMALDPDMNPVEYQRIKSDMLQLERQHQMAIRGLEIQALTERKKYQLQAAQSLSQSWGGTLAQMMTGQMSFAAGVKALWQGLVGAITQALTQMISQWIARKLAALILDKAMTGTTAASQIMANAGAAASGAYAATAVIPVVGPALAPAAAATALAGAMSFMPMAFAAKGFDIPAGVNPITQLHQKEMVLPEQYAEVIRGMADGKGGGDAPAHLHLHGDIIHSPTQLRQWFERNAGAVGAGIKRYARTNGR